jgi:voltage-gated potassium channel
MRDEIAAARPEGWRAHLHEIIFEADTRAGRVFDVTLIIAIVASITVVSLDTVESIAEEHHTLLTAAEWFFTILFSIEYILRLVCVQNRLRYATSFFGIIDLFSVLPTYDSLLLPGAESLLLLRALRLLRIFRIFKLARFLSEERALRASLYAARARIAVFLVTALIAIVLMGAMMFLIEGPENGFSSIPVGMYWAVVTLTTVGYGDVTPQTPVGQLLSVAMMILGYSLIIVPTGILSAELARAKNHVPTSQHCRECSREGHDSDATYCKYCGAAL